VPIEQIKPTRQAKATPRDENPLRRTFVRHFGGVTLLPSSAGYGLRGPDHPEQEPESNCNADFVVLALPPTGSSALRTELQDALDEGVILVERQVVWIP